MRLPYLFAFTVRQSLLQTDILTIFANALFMPEEAADQTRVFMSTATSDVWGDETSSVQGSLALLANTLVKYQPVVIYVSPNDVGQMRSQLSNSVQSDNLSPVLVITCDSMS